jgi:hypothetical protein
LYSFAIKINKRRIKRLIFVLFFLIIPFGIERQDEIHFVWREIVAPDIPKQDDTFQETVSPNKQVKKKKRKKQVLPAAKPPPDFRPIQAGAITELSTGFSSPDCFMMRHLSFDAFKGYQAHRFYIPPVQYKLNPKELIVPAGLLAVSAIATRTTKFRDIWPIERPNPKDRLTPFDDIMQYTVAPSLFIFDAIGKEKHHPVDQFFLTALSYGLTVLPTRYIKGHYISPRPYGGKNSYPSGHTAVAFVGAHIIYKEFKDTNPWIAYSGYAMGAVVAGARVTHDKHWVSDVMAGAGIAMLSTELAYLAYFPVRNLITEESNKLFGKYIILSPIATPQTFGLNLTVQF